MDLLQILRFNASGALSTGLHLGVAWTASSVLGWSLLSANVVAFLIANGASYLLQSRWTFRLRPRSRHRWVGTSLALLVLAGGLGRAADLVLPHARYAWLLAVAPITVVSYLLMRYWVFAPDETAAPARFDG